MHFAGTVLSVARSDYACNHGSSSNVTQTTLRDPTSMEEGVTKTKNKTWEEQKETGVIYRRSEVSDSMIRDGLSNTYLIGEKYCNPTYYELENAPTDNEGMYYGADDDNQRRTHSSSLPMQDRTGYSGNYNFGSPHAGTFGMVLADGSVQRISYSIDAETHSNLGNRADGNPVTIP